MRRQEQWPFTQVFAHRGFAARCPENTLPAFAQAIDAGANGIELDVQMTRDAELVVIHDDTVDRTTNGTGCVGNLTLAQLRRLDAGGWFAPAFSGTRIPTLDQVLALAAGAPGVVVNIELKYADLPYPAMELQVWERVRAYNLVERAVISSFQHERVLMLKRLRPEAKIAVNYWEPLVDPWLYAIHLDADGLHPFHKALTPEVVSASHQHGVRVRVFTVNDARELEKYVAWGVDAVITDRPDLALDVVQHGC